MSSCPHCGFSLVADPYRLTAGESRMAKLLLEGYHVKEIAQLLGVQVTTVKNRLGRVYRKYNVDNAEAFVAQVLLPLNSPLRARIKIRQ